jgi:hypothetical protein
MSRALATILLAVFSAHGPARSATGTIGNGHVKVALSGSGGAIGRSLKNAAEMALEEWGDPDIQLLIEDDGGGAAGAERAARTRSSQPSTAAWWRAISMARTRQRCRADWLRLVPCAGICLELIPIELT